MTRMTEPRLSADLEPRLRDHAAAGRAAAEEPGSPFRLPAVLRSADIRVSPAVWPSTRREEIDP
jgi:hypothetical protein